MRPALLAYLALLPAIFLASWQPLSAHHASRAVYQAKTITLMGTVTNYEWSNPHIIVSVQVKAANGDLQQWHAESLPPAQATAAGWTKNSLKLGDEVTLIGRPGRYAQHIMLLDHLVTPDGRTLGRK